MGTKKLLQLGCEILIMLHKLFGQIDMIGPVTGSGEDTDTERLSSTLSLQRGRLSPPGDRVAVSPPALIRRGQVFSAESVCERGQSHDHTVRLEKY